jgi:hypothetical protein
MWLPVVLGTQRFKVVTNWIAAVNPRIIFKKCMLSSVYRKVVSSKVIRTVDEWIYVRIDEQEKRLGFDWAKYRKFLFRKWSRE